MKFWTLLLGIVLAVLVVVPTALAATGQNQQVVLSKDEVVNHDYFASGDSVTVSGTVNGDSYIAGGNVVVDGKINGSLLVAGGNVSISGTVTQNIRVAGGTVNISGDVGGNVSAVGGNINLVNSAAVAGSLVAAGGNVQVFSPVNKGITVGAGQLTLGNTVGGGVLAAVDQTTLTSKADVKGDLTYISDQEVSLQPSATVSGKITHKPAENQNRFNTNQFKGVLAGVASAVRIMGLVVALVIGLLFIKFFPVYTERTSKFIRNKPWLSFGIGLLAFILTPVVVIILIMTIVGIPLAVLWIIYIFIALYLSKIFVALVLGELVMKWTNQKTNQYLVFVLGLAAYYLLAAIPVLGGIFVLAANLTALGALLAVKKDLYQELHAKNTI